jgi:hypothetical protein
MTTKAIATTSSLAHELTFLQQQTGQNEATLLAQALPLGLNLLYRQKVEELFVNGVLSYPEALNILGEARLTEIQLAQQALVKRIAPATDSYELNTLVPFQKDLWHEFKVIDPYSDDPVKTILARQVEVYLNAFLNTEGGTLYLGIDESRRVQGIPLDDSHKLLLVKAIEQQLDQFQPTVERELYNIRFVPVHGPNFGPARWVVEINVAKGPKSSPHHRYMTAEWQGYLRNNNKVINALIDQVGVFKDDETLLPMLADIYRARGRPEYQVKNQKKNKKKEKKENRSYYASA